MVREERRVKEWEGKESEGMERKRREIIERKREEEKGAASYPSHRLSLSLAVRTTLVTYTTHIYTLATYTTHIHRLATLRLSKTSF